MEDILLAVMLLGLFAFGYFVVDCFGKFMDQNLHDCRDGREPGRRVYIAETDGKSTEVISEEVGFVLNSLPDDDEYEIIICKPGDPQIIEYLEESGCTIEYAPDHIGNIRGLPSGKQ